MTSTSTQSSAPRGGRRHTATLITGAGGEVGQSLIRSLHDAGQRDIIAVDIRELDSELRELCLETFVGDICDRSLLGRLLAMFEIRAIYHLAALLSTRAEFNPETAHEVNVGGTLELLRLAAEQARSHGQKVKFVFPSSIAAHGLTDLETKQSAGAIGEDDYLHPITMYGCNKLYCEHLGRYYARHYRQLAQDRIKQILDFRCLRFPGLISAETLPSGGTSDFAPEMIHAAAEGKAYACFVRPDTCIPFLTMPDAVQAILALGKGKTSSLTQPIYNVRGFSANAGKLAELVLSHFPDAQIDFVSDTQRQAIVDSWPADVDDTAARRDWGFAPAHDLKQAFDDYLVPQIKARYQS